MADQTDQRSAEFRRMSHIAIIGCGQLARMIALAGWERGYSFAFLAEPEESIRCVSGLGVVVYRDEDKAPEDLYRALGRPDVITVEKEHVNVALMTAFTEFCAVAPSPEAVYICQHRGREKTLLQKLGIATAPFREVQNEQSLYEAVEELGYPAFVKSCEQGYDGQNQWILRTPQALESLARKMTDMPALIVEGTIEFSRELSQIAVRSQSGKIVAYPLTENRHREGILLTSEAPAANLSQATKDQAFAIAEKLLNHWSYQGVLSVELFDENGILRVNELAPRVHNSGHWSQDAGVTSQFTNHLRAITGLNPGGTNLADYSGMINLLGRAAAPAITDCEDINLHWYNKSIRSRRKVGHLNLLSKDRQLLKKRLKELETLLYPGHNPP